MKMFAIFGDTGVKAELVAEEFLWHRAVLTKGDYLLSKGKYWSFVVDNDRDYSWKRILRSSDLGKYRETEEKHRGVIKDLIDDPHFNANDIQQSLSSIITEFKEEDWRTNFIKFPQLIACLGKTHRLIQWDDDTDRAVYLLDGMRLGPSQGIYYQMDSYVFYLRYSKDIKFEPFSKIDYYPGKGLDVPAVAYLDDCSIGDDSYALYIFYKIQEQKWELRLFIRVGDEEAAREVPGVIRKAVGTLGFDTSDPKNLRLAIPVHESDSVTMQDEVYKKILDICTVLLEIQVRLQTITC